MTAEKPTDEEITAQTYAERERLADLLSALRPEQWATPSLCAGWRVREVVAHITMPYRTSRRRVLAGLVRARFDFHAYADRAARADTDALNDAELLQSLQANIRHPWRPPGGGETGALSHDVIHGAGPHHRLRSQSHRLIAEHAAGTGSLGVVDPALGAAE